MSENGYPTLKEFQMRQEKLNDLENLRIEMLIAIEKEYNLNSEIMDTLSYDVEFSETLENNNPKSMYNLIKKILKENDNIDLLEFDLY